MKKPIQLTSTTLLMLSFFSCRKTGTVAPDPESLTGNWIIGEYIQIRMNKDSILSAEGWIKDEDHIGNMTKWDHPTDPSLTLTTNESDTTWLHYVYIGDGVCCDVQTINITASSYLTGSIIAVSGDDYTIIKHKGDEDVDTPYRYMINLQIESLYNGCIENYELFKRAGD